jgi:hypothetical protein
MDEHTHPLLTKRMGGAIAVLAMGSSLGLALMSFHLFPAGMILSVIGAIGAISIYWSDFRLLRLRLVDRLKGAIPVFGELWIIVVAVAIAVGAPGYVYFRAMLPVPVSDLSRHLLDDQKARMIPDLRLPVGTSYSIEFNSVQNCDECESYAEELRIFFRELPGWKTGGGVITFGDPSAPREGLQLVLDKSAPDEVANKIKSAFDAASIHLISRPRDDIKSLNLDAIIVVARRMK